MGTIVELLLSVPIILFSLSLHEWAHGYVAYRLGDPTARSLGRLTLNPLKHFDIVGGLCMLLFRFGWAKPVPINSRYFKKPRRDMTLVSLAGPVSNLVLSFLGYFVYCVIGHNAPQNAVFGMMLNFFAIFTVMNLSLAVFNLLPIPPLDGSRLLYLVLPPKWSFKLAELERYSFWVLMLFLFLGGRFGFLTWVINGFLWLFDLAIGWLPFL